MLCRNIYYVPPGEFLTRDTARALERVLGCVVEREREGAALRDLIRNMGEKMGDVRSLAYTASQEQEKPLLAVRKALEHIEQVAREQGANTPEYLCSIEYARENVAALLNDLRTRLVRSSFL
jgi:signal transduction histidine kinase